MTSIPKGKRARKAQTAIIPAKPAGRRRSKAKKGEAVDSVNWVMINIDGRIANDLEVAEIYANSHLGFDKKGEFRHVIVHQIFRGPQTARPTFRHFPPAILKALKALDDHLGKCEPSWQELLSIIICAALQKIVERNERRLRYQRDVARDLNKELVKLETAVSSFNAASK